MSRTKMNVRIPFSAMWSGRRLVSKKSKSSRIVQRRVLHSEFLENRHLLTTFFGPSTFTVLDGFTQATAAAAGGTLLPGIFVASDPAADRHNDGTDPGLTGQFATSRRVDLDWTADAIPDPTNGSFVTAATNTGGVGSLGMNSGDGASATMTLSYNNFQTADPGCFFVLNTDTLIVHFFPTFDKGTNGLPIPFELYVNEPVDGTPHQTKFIDPDSPPGTDLEFPDESFDVSAFVGQQITSISLVLLGDLATDATISGIDAGFFEVCPEIHLEKLVNGELDTEGDCPLVPVGSTVTFTYEVTNPGNVPLSDVGVTDNPVPGSGQPAPVLLVGFNIGDTDQDDLLDPGETWLFEASTTPALLGEHDNTATASGQPVGEITNGTTTLVELGDPIEDTDEGCYEGAPIEIHLEKLVNGLLNTEINCPTVAAGSTVTYEYRVTNPGAVDLTNVQVTDNPVPGSGQPVEILGGDGIHNIGDIDLDDLLDHSNAETWLFTASSIASAVAGHHDNLATASAVDVILGEEVMDTDPGCYNIVVQAFEGLTPGFWKNNAVNWDAVAWGPTGFSPNQTLESVFDIPDSLGMDNVTLLQALGLKGGGVNALLRQAVAAVLNASHPLITYQFSLADTINMVNAALASGDKTQIENVKNLLDTANNAGGGVDQHGNEI